MANLNSVLNERISRLARKEIRNQTGTTKKLAVRHRSDIAAMRRTIHDLERRLALIERITTKHVEQMPRELPQGTRFAPRNVKAQRRRLGLSAREFGKLVGVTGLTVYSWETGKFRPRAPQLAALVALRKTGKREAIKRLEMQR